MNLIILFIAYFLIAVLVHSATQDETGSFTINIFDSCESLNIDIECDNTAEQIYGTPKKQWEIQQAVLGSKKKENRKWSPSMSPICFDENLICKKSFEEVSKELQEDKEGLQDEQLFCHFTKNYFGTEVEMGNIQNEFCLLNFKQMQDILLICDEIDVNAIGCLGLTPLEHALGEENWEKCLFLISKGANVNQIRGTYGVPLLQSARLTNSLEQIEFLLSNGAEDTLYCQNCGYQVNFILGLPCSHEMCTFCFAILFDYNRKLKIQEMCSNVYKNIIPELYDVQIFMAPSYEQIYLNPADLQKELGFLCAFSLNTESLKEFLGENMKTLDLDRPGFFDKSPLEMALNFNRLDVAEFLIKNGARVNQFNKEGYPPIHIALINENLEHIDFLLRQFASINYKLFHFYEPEGPAFFNACTIDIIKNLVERNLILNQEDFDGNTALHFAIQIQNIELASLLLEKKRCKVRIQNHLGETAFFLAAKCGNVELLELLLKNDTPNHEILNVHNKNLYLPICIAIEKLHFYAVEYLANYTRKINFRRMNGATIVHLIAKTGHVDMLKILVKKQFIPRSSLELEDLPSKYTPLYYAIFYGHEFMAHELLKMGAQIDASIFTASLTLGDEVLIELLCKYGANVNNLTTIVNNSIMRYIVYAVKLGNLKIIKLLLDYGAKTDESILTFSQNGPSDIHSYLTNIFVFKRFVVEGDMDNAKELVRTGELKIRKYDAIGKSMKELKFIQHTCDKNNFLLSNEEEFKKQFLSLQDEEFYQLGRLVQKKLKENKY